MDEITSTRDASSAVLPSRPRRIWLRSFFGFRPEDDGYIGWTQVERRDRMLGLVEDGDLFMIYGAASTYTRTAERNKVIGFLQVAARPIRDVKKASQEGLERKRTRGWQDRWTFAMPVVRAWRVDEPILLERIAAQTYRPEAGQAIAVWSPPLLPDEVDLALKIKVTETSVFGEPPIDVSALSRARLAEAFRPSQAFPGGFGPRVSVYEDGATCLYLARFKGEGHQPPAWIRLTINPSPEFRATGAIHCWLAASLLAPICDLRSRMAPARPAHCRRIRSHRSEA